jgi:hypothetical protein
VRAARQSGRRIPRKIRVTPMRDSDNTSRLRAAFSCAGEDHRAVECGRLKQGMTMTDKPDGKRWGG